MGAELLGLAAGTESAGKLLRSVDRRNTQFLDVLIEHEQKQTIAASAVQRYLQELWIGSLGWPSWKLLLLFTCFLIFPPIWILMSLPCGHKYYKVPIIKFMSYLVSHIYLMILISLTAITPIFQILRTNFFPNWIEWALLVWLLGVIVGEISNPSDKSGLGWIKLAVIFFCTIAIIFHGLGFVFGKSWAQHIFYWRNQFFGFGMLAACVQILDFVSFHYLFGPWAIIIGNLMRDLARFLAVLAIFMFGFSMVITALNQPFTKRTAADMNMTKPRITNGLTTGVIITPVDALEALFFAIFGLRNTDDLKWETAQPNWTIFLFKFVHACYLLVTVIVLINLLIAMMSDTYQRIQAQSDIEWKFGLAKLIRNMHRTSATPSPLNLLTSWIVWIVRQCKKKREPYNPFKKTGEKVGPGLKGLGAKGLGGMMQFGKATPKQLWKKSINKAKGGGPRVSDIMRLTVPQVGATPVGSATAQRSNMSQRIETAVDWDHVVKKYRILVGREEIIHEDQAPLIPDK